MGGDDEKKKMVGATPLKKSYFDVVGLCCSSEVPLIEKILKPLEGVKDVSVIVPSRTVIVLHDSLLISELQIVNALNKARLEANVRVCGEKNYEKRWPSPFAVACGVFLLLSFLKHFYHPLRWLALAAVALGIFPIILKALAALRTFTLDINILMLLAVGGSIALRDYWEAGTIVFLFTIAEWLESRASHKATAVMSSLVNIVPQTAIIAETGEQVKADQVQINTILAVKPGDVIPIDGIVVQGKCDVDEKTLTGESFPVSKQIDSTVWAGTINLNGYVSVSTTALAADCVVARMANLVEEAQNNKSQTQRFIDECANYYTPIIVVMSACLAIIPAALRVHNLNEWYHLALVVLVSACPCALILSTPVATFCALSNAATSGLLVKGAEYLETLAKVKIMAFDKTGTITKGEFVVADFKALLDDVSLNMLLYWLASIESKSSHPMAAALVDYAHSFSVEPRPDEVMEFHNFPGEGICGKIDGKDIYVGNRKIAARAGCVTIPTIEGDAKEGKSIGYIFLGSSPAGIFSLSDVCRSGVKEAIQELKSMGIKTVMLTGDCEEAAKHAQDQLGGALDLVHTELLPEDKARIIKEFQNESPTAMIGDGLNDAAALATSDIGISMGISGSALAMETGNIILLSNDIRKIPQAFRLARKTCRKIIQNMFLSVITKAAIIGLAIAGHPLVWAAVLADVGTCLLVIFNSMLLLGSTSRHGKKSCKSSAGHVHKHGSKTAHSHSTHSHKNCCSGTKAEKKHTPLKCSKFRSEPLSSVSCTSNKCNTAVSAENHGCCGSHTDQTQERKNNVVPISESSSDPSHQNCCSGNQAEKKTCSPKSSGDISVENHGCCEHTDKLKEVKHTGAGLCAADECVDSIEKGHGHDGHGHGHCVHNHVNHEAKHSDGIHQAKHCEHVSSSAINHDTKSHHQHFHKHSVSSTDELGQKNMIITNSDCHLSLAESAALSNMVKTCCKHGTEQGVQLIHSDIDSSSGTNHVDCTAKKACSSLEMRCCQSFRKECCGKINPHFGVGFGGNLSEITIE